MTTLDASLRLRLINELSQPAQVAKKDIEALKAAAKGVDSAGGQKLAADLKRAGDAAEGGAADVKALRAEATRLGDAAGGALAADLKRAGAAAEDAKADVQALRGVAANLDGGQKLANDLARAEKAVGKATAAVAALRGEASALEGGDKLAADLARADRAVVKAKASVQALRGATAQIDGAPAEALAAGLGRAGKAAKAAGRGIEDVADDAKKLARSNAGAGLAKDLKRADAQARRLERELKAVVRAAFGVDQTKVGAPLAAGLARAGAAAGKAQKDIAGMRAEAARLANAKADGLAAGLRRTSDAADQLERDLRDVLKAAYQIERARPLDRLAKGMSEAGRAADRTGREIDDVRRSADRLPRDAGRRLAGGLDGVGRAARGAKGELAGVRREAEQAEGALKRLYRNRVEAMRGGERGQADRPGISALMPMGMLAPWLSGAAVAGAGMKTFGASISIEKSLAEVRKFYDLNDAQLAGMKREIFEMVDELGKAPEAIAEVYAKGGQAGVPQAEIRGYTRDVLLFSNAWQTAGAETADAIGTMKAIFKVDRQQILNIAGAVNAVADGLSGPVDERGLLEFLNLAGSTGQGLAKKLSAKEILAFGGAFASIGMQTSKGANAFNSMISKLSDAEGLSKDAKKEMKALKMDPKAVQLAVKTGGVEGIVGVLERLAKAKDLIKATNEIFGLEYGNEIRDLINVLPQLRTALALTADDKGNVDKLIETYKTYASTTDAQLERTRANLAMTADAQAAGYLDNVKAGLKAVNDELARLREQGSVFDELAAGAQGFAKGLGYENAGKMLEDMGARLREALQPTETPAARQAGLFQAAREQAESFRKELEYIRDLYASLPTIFTGFSKEERKSAADRVNRRFDDDTVKMDRDAKAKGLTPLEGWRRWAIGEERYKAAEKRLDDAARAAAPPPMPAPPPADRKAATDRLRDALAARAGRMASGQPDPVVAAGDNERRIDRTIGGRIGGAFAVPLDGGARDGMDAYVSALATGGARAIEVAEQAGRRIRAALDLTGVSAIAPNPAEARQDVDRKTATDALRAGLADRARQPAATPQPQKVPVEPELKIDTTIRGRVESAFAVPLEQAAQSTMRGYASELEAGGARAVEIAKSIGARIKAALDIAATPTITPRFSAAGGAGAGGATPAAPAGGGASPAPGKQSRLDRPGGAQLASLGGVRVTQNIYGQRDPAATARAAQRRQNAAIREAKARSLHDLGSPTA